MKKYFIFGDVHGYYDILKKALDEKGFDVNNPDHIIISLGDLLDRGRQPKECLDFVNNLPNERKILVKGNHEDLMEEAIQRCWFKPHDYHNKTHQTVYDLVGHSGYEKDALQEMISYEPWKKYIESCVDYYELKDNIFVHGWIPYYKTKFISPDKIEYDYEGWREGDWKSARWMNGMKEWISRSIKGKTIWCGHWHTSWGHSYLHNDGKEFLDRIETYYIDPDTGKTEPHVNFDPFIDDGIIAIDACVAYSNKINVVTLEDQDEEGTMKDKIRVYLASQIFAECWRDYNEKLASAIEEEYPDISLYVPQRNKSINDKTKCASAEDIAYGDFTQNLDKDDIVVAVLDGDTPGIGTVTELGYFARMCQEEIEKYGYTKKTIIALYTDSRECSNTYLEAKNEKLKEFAECQYSYLNLLTVGAVKRYGVMCRTIPEVIEQLGIAINRYKED